jgi:flagellar motor switch protein FliG
MIIQWMSLILGINLEERNLILKEAYWDILSLNMLGKEVLKTRFSMLADLSNDKLQRLLSSQEAKVRALTLMHLPEEKAQEYFLDLDQEEKKKMIEDSSQLNFVREDDLEALDEKYKLQFQSDQQPEGVVDVADFCQIS